MRKSPSLLNRRPNPSTIRARWGSVMDRLLRTSKHNSTLVFNLFTF